MLPVCVVIVSYNRIDDLRRCLTSLRRAAPAVARVVVIDNGSRDGTPAMVRAEHPWADLHEVAENLGPCVARNQAAAMSDQPLLWFLDSDTELVDPAGAARLAGLFDHAEVQAAGGEAVLDGAGKVVGTKRLFLTANAMVQGTTITGAEPVSRCRVIASCNLMIRRSAFDRLGGFDPFYFFFYEDVDLTFRASALGHLLALSPMPVVHRYSESVRIDGLWLESRNRMYFILKNLEWWRLALLPMLDAVTVLRADSVARLWRRSRRAGGAIGLVTVGGGARSRGASLGQAAMLIGRMLAKLVLAYAAIPVVLGPALAARRAGAGAR